MSGIEDATIDATWWGKSAKPSEMIWAVYELLVERGQIASRISEILGKNRSTVSRHIKKLEREQYITRSVGFEAHVKRIENTSKKSVSGYSKAYIKGNRAAEADRKISEIKGEVGVRAGPSLPGGAKPMIDIHRIDINLPANTKSPNKGLPRGNILTNEHWDKVTYPDKLVRGWASIKGESIETSVGNWNVYFRRRGKKVGDHIEWGDFCLPNPVRITLPDRLWLTPEECLDEKGVNSRLMQGIYEVSAKIQKKYGFILGMPKSKNSQLYEAGALRYDPDLAEKVRRNRTASGKGMLEVAEGITADGSHDLLKDDFVHLDCETPLQAAMQANPVSVLDHLMKESLATVEQMRKVGEETIVTIEEHAVKSSDSIQQQFEGSMGNLVERMMNSFNQRFEEHMQRFFDRQNRRAERIMQEFQDRLQGIDPDMPETQTSIFQFIPEKEWPDDS